jgi:hypothetical protein
MGGSHPHSRFSGLDWSTEQLDSRRNLLRHLRNGGEVEQHLVSFETEEERRTELRRY